MMKEEELIEELGNVKLPTVELPSHRYRLRSALLATGYPKGPQGASIWQLAKSRIKGVEDIMIRALMSPQPVWKLLVSGVVAIAIIAGLTLGVPSFTGQSARAMAEDIVKNSLEARMALGEDDFDVVDFAIDDGIITIVCESSMGKRVVLTVNLITKVATRVEDDKIVVTKSVKIREVSKQNAIDIAKNDTRIQDLLTQGASIVEVQAVLFSEKAIDAENIEGIEGRSEMRAIVHIKHDKENWLVYVDLWREKVDRLTKMPQTDSSKIQYIPK
jgi:hypothetical protein